MTDGILEKLKEIVENLPDNFYGSVEIGFQKSMPGTVKVTQSYRLDNPANTSSSRSTNRGANSDIARK